MKILKNIMKISLSIFLIGIILAQPLVPVAYTFADSMTSQDTQLGINNYLKSLNETSVKTTQTTECALYNLKNIIKLATWVDALEQLKEKERLGEDVYNFPSKVIDYEKQILINKIKAFNETFGNGDTDALKSVKVNESVANDAYSFGTLVADTKEYLAHIMDDLLAESNDVEVIAKANKKLLRYIYYVATANTTVAESFNALMPFKTTSDTSDRTLSFEYSPVNTLFNLTSDSTYSDLIIKGRELALSDSSSLLSGEPDESAELIDIFLKEAERKDETVIFDSISEYWYLYFACGATYQPLTSSAGDSIFMDVLKNVTGETNSDKYQEVYRRAIRYKKPLYFMSTNSNGETEGKATVATLGKLMEYVEDLEDKALVLAKGKMAAGKDDNSFYYAQTNTETSTPSGEQSSPIDNLQKSEVTSPVLRLGKSSLNVITLQNIFTNAGNLNQYSPDSASLYMNVFGDIVLEDGTIILPGCANSTFYKSEKSYYPYTIAFMQNYPNMSMNSTFSTSKDNKGKRILMTEFENKSYTDLGMGALASNPDYNPEEPMKGSEFSQNNNYEVKWTYIKGKESIKSSVTGFYVAKDRSIDLTTYDFDDAESVFAIKDYEYDAGNILQWIPNTLTSISTSLTNTAIITKNSIDSGSNNILYLFENNIAEQDIKELSKIARNFFAMIYTDENGKESTNPSPRFSSNTLGKYVIGEVLNGLTSVQGYENYRSTSYEQLVADESNRLKVKIVGVLKDFTKPLYDITGVIGIENAYQSDILGTVVSYAKIFLAFILIALFIALIFKFITGMHDLLQTTLFTAMSVIIGFLFVSVLPVYLPVLFNGALNITTIDESSDLGYMSLLMHIEDYEKTYASKGDNTLSNTSSINLYKFTDSDLDELCEQYDLDKAEVLSGKLVVLDDNAGIYLEGNILKCSLDSLFVNNPITGSYSTSSTGKYYTLKSQKMASSCIDYYTPYHLIVDALVEKLNTFSQVYRPRREFINYGSLIKDSFLMRDYLISPSFLDPSNTDLIGESIDLETQDLAESLLGTNEDVFNLGAVFRNPTDMVKGSLWYSTLAQNGRLTESALNRMIEKATLNTKNFLIDNYDKLQYISDENIIKVTALYLTTSISRTGGTFNNELYPMFINSEEFNLSDILLGSYVTDREQFRFKDLEIVNYIADKFGVIWAILFCINIFVSWALLSITKYIIPLLYVALGILLIVKYVFRQEQKYLVKGYIRGSILIFLAYLVHCLMLILSSKLNGSVFSIIVPLVVNMNCLEMIIKYIVTLFTKDPLNLGGRTSIAAIAPWIANKLGITAAMVSLGNMGRMGQQGSYRAYTGARDAYANYRDYNAYDSYSGQEGVIEQVMQAQRGNQANREYHIDRVTSDGEKFKVRRTRKRNKNNDVFRDYRE